MEPAALFFVVLMEFALTAFVVIAGAWKIHNDLKEARIRENRRNLKPYRIIEDFCEERG